VDTKVKLKVHGLTNSQIQSGAYALVLSEDDGPRRLPVIVGLPEAQSIAIALEELQPPRPLTHDLFVHFARMLQIRLTEVFIYKFDEGVFYAEMVFMDGTHEIRIDSRTSDAVAIAIRMKSNIYTLESILQKCGIILDESHGEEKGDMILSSRLDPEESGDHETLKERLRTLHKTEIEERMEKAIGEENYEYAKVCKEELQRREKEDRENDGISRI
jgi:bifunctional DNase/RNase